VMPKVICIRLALVAAVLAAAASVGFASVAIIPQTANGVVATSPVIVPPLPPTCPGNQQTCELAPESISAVSPVIVPPLPPTCPGNQQTCELAPESISALSPVIVPPLPPTCPGNQRSCEVEEPLSIL
jgi:hypothetical protein